MTKFPFFSRKLSIYRRSTPLARNHDGENIDIHWEHPFNDYANNVGHANDGRLAARFGFAAPADGHSIDTSTDDQTYYDSSSVINLNASYASAPRTPTTKRKSQHIRNSSTGSRASWFGRSNERRESIATMVCEAAAAGDMAQIGRLLGAGAKVDQKSSSGLIPVHLAATGGHLTVLKGLVMHGAKLNVMDEEKRSPLHVAVISARTDVVPFLISHGAPLQAKDVYGKTAMDYAEELDSEGRELPVEEEPSNKVRFSYIFTPETDLKSKRMSTSSIVSCSRRKTMQSIIRHAAEARGVRL